MTRRPRLCPGRTRRVHRACQGNFRNKCLNAHKHKCAMSHAPRVLGRTLRSAAVAPQSHKHLIFQSTMRRERDVAMPARRDRHGVPSNVVQKRSHRRLTPTLSTSSRGRRPQHREASLRISVTPPSPPMSRLKASCSPSFISIPASCLARVHRCCPSSIKYDMDLAAGRPRRDIFGGQRREPLRDDAQLDRDVSRPPRAVGT